MTKELRQLIVQLKIIRAARRGTDDDKWITEIIDFLSKPRMKLVVIESPLSAPTREEIEINKDYAKRAMMDSLMMGEAPYASHLLFDQPGLLNDLETEPRDLGIRAGFAWGEKADLVAVYTDLGISDGMRRGIERAQDQQQPIQYRSIGEEKDASR